MENRIEKIFKKYASIKVKGFSQLMTKFDFEQAIEEVIARLQLNKSKTKKKGVKWMT